MKMHKPLDLKKIAQQNDRVAQLRTGLQPASARRQDISGKSFAASGKPVNISGKSFAASGKAAGKPVDAQN
jgi:hypothetical protein